MFISQGRKRVIIAEVAPQVEEGRYPAKAVEGETVVISAAIFCDGHDSLGAAVLLRKEGERRWKEFPLQAGVNDLWEATVRMESTGLYWFQVEAWVDHFESWRYALRKKLEAGQDLALDFLIGAELLEKAALRAGTRDKRLLLKRAETLRDSAVPEEMLATALDPALSALMRRYRDPDLLCRHGQALSIEVERKKAAFSTWYELFPRSAAAQPGQHGSLRDVQRLLPRIARMGFDVLYLPPIHPIGEVKRKGKNNSLEAGPEDPGSPWAIGSRFGGHKSIHPQLGTLKDFKALVSGAARHGIEIALDIAFQCAPDHPYVKEHPEWFKWRPDGSVQYAENPPKKYEDILPFDFETTAWKELWEELKSVVEYWVGQGVHIFRVDNPHTKAFAFWEWMIREVRKGHPQVIFLAEAFTRPRLMDKLGRLGFTQSYTYFTWRNTRWELEEYMRELTKTPRRYYFRPNFWPNTPDILPPVLSRGGENAHIMRLVLAATLSSSYGLYGPVYEFGINIPHPGKEEYTDNEKYEIKYWDWEAWTRTGEIIARVNRIRKQHSALQSTWNIEFAESSNEQIICYAKADPDAGSRLIIAVNLDPFHTQGAHVRIPLDALGIPPDRPYRVRDLLSGDKFIWHDEWNYVQLDPYRMPAHIFQVELDIN